MKNLAGLVLGCGCLAGTAFADPAPEPRRLSASEVDQVAVGAFATVTHAEPRQALTAAQMDTVTAGNPAAPPLTSLRLLSAQSLLFFATQGCLLGCDQQSGSSSSSSAQDGAGYVPPQFPGTTPTPTPPQFP